LGEYNMTLNIENGTVTNIMGGKENASRQTVLKVNDEPFYLKGNYEILTIEER